MMSGTFSTLLKMFLQPEQDNIPNVKKPLSFKRLVVSYDFNLHSIRDFLIMFVPDLLVKNSALH